MRIVNWTLILIAVVAPVQGQNPQASFEALPSIRVDARLVNVPVSVRDRDGNVIAGLKLPDFEILDNSRKQPISHFAEEESAPLSVAFLLETNARTCGCRYQYLAAEKAAADQLVATSLRPADTGQLASFGEGGLRLWQRYTSSGNDLRSALLRIAPERLAGSIDLFDALHEIATSARFSRPGRKFLVLLSGGIDFHSASLSKAVKALRASETIVIGLPFLDDSTLTCLQQAMAKGEAKSIYSAWKDNGMTNLDWLCRQTGGKMFQPGQGSTSDSFLADLFKQARQQYSIGYPPPVTGQSGQFHRVEVRCRVRGARVIARPGYYDSAL